MFLGIDWQMWLGLACFTPWLWMMWLMITSELDWASVLTAATWLSGIGGRLIYLGVN